MAISIRCVVLIPLVFFFAIVPTILFTTFIVVFLIPTLLRHFDAISAAAGASFGENMTATSFACVEARSQALARALLRAQSSLSSSAATALQSPASSPAARERLFDDVAFLLLGAAGGQAACIAATVSVRFVDGSVFAASTAQGGNGAVMDMALYSVDAAAAAVGADDVPLAGSVVRRMVTQDLVARASSAVAAADLKAAGLLATSATAVRGTLWNASSVGVWSSEATAAARALRFTLPVGRTQAAATTTTEALLTATVSLDALQRRYFSAPPPHDQRAVADYLLLDRQDRLVLGHLSVQHTHADEVRPQKWSDDKFVTLADERGVFECSASENASIADSGLVSALAVNQTAMLRGPFHVGASMKDESLSYLPLFTMTLWPALRPLPGATQQQLAPCRQRFVVASVFQTKYFFDQTEVVKTASAVFFPFGIAALVAAVFIVSTVARSVQALSERMQDPWNVVEQSRLAREQKRIRLQEDITSGGVVSSSVASSVASPTLLSGNDGDCGGSSSSGQSRNDGGFCGCNDSDGASSLSIVDRINSWLPPFEELHQLEDALVDFGEVIRSVRGFMSAQDFSEEATARNRQQEKTKKNKKKAAADDEAAKDELDKTSPSSAAAAATTSASGSGGVDEPRGTHRGRSGGGLLSSEEDDDGGGDTSPPVSHADGSGNNFSGSNSAGSFAAADVSDEIRLKKKKKGVKFALNDPVEFVGDGSNSTPPSAVGDATDSSTESVSSAAAATAASAAQDSDSGDSSTSTTSPTRRRVPTRGGGGATGAPPFIALAVCANCATNLHEALREAPAVVPPPSSSERALLQSGESAADAAAHRLVARSAAVASAALSLLSSTGATLIELRGDHLMLIVRMRSDRRRSGLASRFIVQLIATAEAINAEFRRIQQQSSGDDRDGNGDNGSATVAVANTLTAGVSIGYMRSVTLPGDSGPVSRSVSFVGGCFGYACRLERFVRGHQHVLRRRDALPHAIAIETAQVDAFFQPVVENLGEMTLTQKMRAIAVQPQAAAAAAASSTRKQSAVEALVSQCYQHQPGQSSATADNDHDANAGARQRVTHSRAVVVASVEAIRGHYRTMGVARVLAMRPKSSSVLRSNHEEQHHAREEDDDTAATATAALPAASTGVRHSSLSPPPSMLGGLTGAGL